MKPEQREQRQKYSNVPPVNNASFLECNNSHTANKPIIENDKI